MIQRTLSLWLLYILVLAPVTAAAGTFTWQEVSADPNGNWGDASHWDPNGGPPNTTTDTAIIDQTLANPADRYSVHVEGDYTAQTLVLDSDQLIFEVDPTRTLQLGGMGLTTTTFGFVADRIRLKGQLLGGYIGNSNASGTNLGGVLNNGRITIRSGEFNASPRIFTVSKGFINGPDGQILMGRSTTLDHENVLVVTEGRLTNYGLVESNAYRQAQFIRADLDNQGEVRVLSGAGSSSVSGHYHWLVFDRSDRDHFNGGTFYLNENGWVRFTGANSTFTNEETGVDGTRGVIENDGQFQFFNNNTLIHNGIIKSATAGSAPQPIEFLSSNLSLGDSSAGGHFVFFGHNNHLHGTIQGIKEVEVEQITEQLAEQIVEITPVGGTGSSTTVEANDDGGLLNYGTINFSGSQTLDKTSTLVVNSGPLTNYGSITADTYRIEMFLNANLDNRGHVDILSGDGGDGLGNHDNWISFNNAGAVHSNSGIFNVGSHGVARFNGSGSTFTNEDSGIINVGGQLDLAETDLTNLGLVMGSGQIRVLSGSTFSNLGTVAPGTSPGILNVSGIYDQPTSGELAIEIGGSLVGDEYDRLAVSSSANIDGLLSVEFLDDYVPLPTDIFTVLTASNINGNFSNAIDTLSVPGQGVFDITYNSVSVQLSNFQAVPEPGSLVLGALASLCLLRLRWRTRAT